jgi:hypothetical protein
MEFEELKQELELQEYFNICQCVRTGNVYALHRFIFTIGLMCNVSANGYTHRYCYGSLPEAVPALRDWQAKGFDGEPSGYIKRKP